MDLTLGGGNLVSGVVINIEDIIGRTTIDNYFHYLVSVFVNFLIFYSSYNLGIYDRA